MKIEYAGCARPWDQESSCRQALLAIHVIGPPGDKGKGWAKNCFRDSPLANWRLFKYLMTVVQVKGQQQERYRSKEEGVGEDFGAFIEARLRA
eukprot:6202945-Pleurochrysis_carterae.AAC.2